MERRLRETANPSAEIATPAGSRSTLSGPAVRITVPPSPKLTSGDPSGWYRKSTES